MSLVMILAGACISILAWMGAWKLRHQVRSLWLLMIYVFLLPVPYYFIIVGFRYQASLLPFALVMAAYAVYLLMPLSWRSANRVVGAQCHQSFTSPSYHREA